MQIYFELSQLKFNYYNIVVNVMVYLLLWLEKRTDLIFFLSKKVINFDGII